MRVRTYWVTRGWQVVLGEVIIWLAAIYQDVDLSWVYGFFALMVGVAYVLGTFREHLLLWLVGYPFLFMAQGIFIDGLGAVTALSYLIPYTIAGMLASGRERVLVQLCCVLAFWFSLIYEATSSLPQLSPPNSIAVSYNILLAAFMFQTMRFLNHLAVEINTAHVAQEVQQRSQHFLARVSHELRTPLNSVLGFSKLLTRGNLDTTQQTYLQQVIAESEHLNHLVSDLLDSAHLATGKLSLNLSLINVNAVCQNVADEHQGSLSDDVNLRLAFDPQLPQINVDEMRLRQIVGNLVSNAVKYTSQGEISITTIDHMDTITIQVKDTGIGISEAEQQLIFVPFVQLDNRRVGVGLGLDIARQLTELHGGTINLESLPGEGSVFTIMLPKDLNEPK